MAGQWDFLCTRECVGADGRRWHPGDRMQLHSGEIDIPPGGGWVQVRAEPERAAGPDLPFIGSGRGRVSWRERRSAPVPPVTVHDPLRGEVVDEAATLKARNAAFEADRLHDGLVRPSRQVAFQRHLDYLRRMGAALPEDHAAEDRDVPPPAQAGAEGDGGPLPASPEAIPQGEDLDALLDAEAQAQAAGDQDKLLEIRARIDRAVK